MKFVYAQKRLNSIGNGCWTNNGAIRNFYGINVGYHSENLNEWNYWIINFLVPLNKL